MSKKQKKRQFDHSVVRLVIRNIQGYSTYPVLAKRVKRQVNVCPQLDQLKQRVLDLLLLRQSKRKAKLVQWIVAWQTHAASGLPHLDILLVYDKNVNANYTTYDYLIKDLSILQREVGDEAGVGHVWVTPYSSKKLNRAILDYGQKQDPAVITNLSLQRKQQMVAVSLLKADPYCHLELQMLKDPLHFNLEQYCRQHDLFKHISGWSSIKTKLKDSQLAAANLQLRSKSGFRYIDNTLIEANLNSDQLKVYYSWNGYQTIVDKLNEIVVYGGKRPFKTKQLLLVGKPNTGKTSLIRQIQKYTAVYHMDVSNWFPCYRDGVYPVIAWNQFKLKGGMPHTDLLKFLEGYPMDLQYKGGSSLRRDNQLTIMTSNMSLDQHLKLKFKDEEQRNLARANLRVRIEQIILPSGVDLFMLQKLLISGEL